MKDKRYKVLRKIYERLKDSDVSWAVIGSTGLALNGVDVKPKDIDIIVDGEDAFEVEKRLSEFVTEEVEYSESERFRSYFGKFEIKGIKVEVMGDLERKVDGNWKEPTKVDDNLERMKVRGMNLPVFSLERELASYEELGRIARANKIREHLNNQDGK